MNFGVGEVWFVLVALVSLLVPLVIAAGVGYLVWDRRRERERRLPPAEEMAELREEVALMRDLVADLLARLRQLEGRSSAGRDAVAGELPGTPPPPPSEPRR